MHSLNRREQQLFEAYMSDVRHLRCVLYNSKEFGVLILQSNTTI